MRDGAEHFFYLLIFVLLYAVILTVDIALKVLSNLAPSILQKP